MRSEDTKIFKFNHYQKSDKAQFIIYADLEGIIEKIDGWKNNPKNSLFINKSFGQLLDISTKNFIFLKTFNSGFPYIEVWFTDRNSKPLWIFVFC